MTSGIRVRGETDDDHDAIRRLLVEAFGRPDEARLVDRLRADGDLAMSLVADRGGVLGHIGFSRLRLDDERVEALALAPLAVAPAQRGQGIAEALVRQGLGCMAVCGYDLVLVLGDPAFYDRFGFDRNAVKVTTPYDGPNLLALAIDERGAEATGAARYPRAFSALA